MHARSCILIINQPSTSNILLIAILEKQIAFVSTVSHRHYKQPTESPLLHKDFVTTNESK